MLAILKFIIDNFDKIHKICKKYSVLEGFKLFIMLSTFLMVYHFLFRDIEYNFSKRDNDVIRAIKEVIKGCGENTSIGWIVVEDKRGSGEARDLDFKGLYTGIKNNDNIEIVDAVLSNAIYLDTYQLNNIDYSFLKNDIEDLQLVHCDINNGGNASCPEYTPQILSFFTQKTNLPLTGISYIVVKTNVNNIVFVFTISMVKNTFSSCTWQTANQELITIAKISKNIKND